MKLVKPDVIGRSVLGSLLIKIMQIVIGLLSVVVLSALLGPEEFGRYAFAFSWIQVLHVIAMFGLHQLVVRDVAVAWGLEDRSRLRVLLIVAFGIPMLIAGIPALLGIASRADSLNLSFLKEILGEPALVLLGVFPIAIVGIQGGVLQGIGWVLRSQIPAILIRPAVFLSIIALAWWLPCLKLDARLALGAQISGSGIAVLVAWWWLRPVWKKAFYDEKNKPVAKWEDSVGPFSVGVFFLLNLVTVLMGRVDTLMLGWLASSSEVGVYALVAQAADLVPLALVAVRMPLAPRVAHAAKTNSLNDLQPVLARYTRMAFVLALCLVTGYGLFGSWLLGILNPTYSTGMPALMVLSVVKAAGVGFGMMVMLLNMTGKENISLIIMTAAVGLNIFLNYLFIPLWGILGCALATSASLLCMQVVLSVVTSRQLGIGPLGMKTRSL